MSRNSEEHGDGLFSALAHGVRREILRYLRDKDYVRAGDIGAALSVAPSTLSGHLKVLRQAGLVEVRRRGTEVQYRLQMSLLDEAILALADLRRPGAPGTGENEPPDPAGRQIDTQPEIPRQKGAP